MIPVRRLLWLLVLLCTACDLLPPVGSSAPPETTAVTRDEVVTVSCDGDGGLLCEGYDLIQRHYVDPVTDRTLAEAAAAGVAALDLPAQPGRLTCAIPNSEFQPVCDVLTSERPPEEAAGEAALAGMVSALDPNSAYFDRATLRVIEEDQSGQVEGIGALVASEDLTAADPRTTPCPSVSATCRVVVISVFAGSPADRAGLAAGDVIVGVDGRDIEGWTIDQVTAEVRGAAGTRVTLQVERDGRVIDLGIVREALAVPVVETETFGSTGYLRLSFFTDTSDRQVENALNALVTRGVTRLVLDLRDNPGGALDATVVIASQFLEGGVVVRTVSPGDEEVYRARPGGVAPDLDLAVVVNRGSASASEVLAAALQEAGRASIVGENTFGKNTVQQRFDLSNGGALKLTVARWVTDGGHDFGGEGLSPDIAADLPADLTPGELTSRVSTVLGWPAPT
jgi:carboxyl-terminal processing protease